MVPSLQKLLTDIELLQMEFPVSAIAARTGVDKGNVSAYLKGRKPLGKKFIKQFYGAFEEEIRQAKSLSKEVTLPAPSRLSFDPNTLLTDDIKTIERISQKLNRLETLARHLLHQHKKNSMLIEQLRKELNIKNISRHQ